VALFLAVFSISCLAAQADDLGVDFTGYGGSNSSSVWNLGYEFQANVNANVTALGVMDFGSATGLPQAQQVGLWTSGGTLLASTYVDSSGQQIGNWLFETITPVALTAGQDYVVGSQGGEGYVYYTTGFTVAPEISFIQDQYYPVGGGSNNPLYFPNETAGITAAQGGAFFGGNVKLSSPEPGSLTLLGWGLVGLAGLVRRKRIR
jgi:hypothetical protein